VETTASILFGLRHGKRMNLSMENVPAILFKGKIKRLMLNFDVKHDTLVLLSQNLRPRNSHLVPLAQLYKMRTYEQL
jgi:hypothetical protein